MNAIARLVYKLPPAVGCNLNTLFGVISRMAQSLTESEERHNADIPQEKPKMASEQLTQEQKGEFLDGSISSLMKWGPKLLPNITQALRNADGMIQIRASFMGERSEGFRALKKADTTRIRAMIEMASVEQFGIKFRIDRVDVSDYVEVIADENAVTSDWLGDIPAWDETPRLKKFGEIFGVESSVYVGGHSPSEDARVCELAGRSLFMHPCYHAKGIPAPVPVVVFVDCIPSDLRRLMAPILRGPMREVNAVVTTEQQFAEAFDPFTSHILLPEMPQVMEAQHIADIGRFATVVRQSSVHYRPPYHAQAVTVNLPMMVGSISSDKWRTVARDGIPILPLSVRSDEEPAPETVAQCYAEAMAYAGQGHPIVKRGLETVQTVWRNKREARV